MRKRYRLFAFRIYEYKLLEEYLNLMAEKGWIIKSYHKHFAGLLVFEKAEPDSIEYMVDYYAYQKVKDEEEGLRSYREFVEDFGYRFLAGDGGLQIYEKIREDAVVIREEDEENLASMRTTIKAALRSYLGSLAFMMLMLYSSVQSFRSSFFLNDSAFFSIIVFLCAMIEMSVLAFTDIVWMIRKEKKMVLWKVTTRTVISYLLFVIGALSAIGWLGVGMLACTILLIILVLAYRNISRKLESREYTSEQKRIRRFWMIMGCFAVMMFGFWNVSCYHDAINDARKWNTPQNGLFAKAKVLRTYEQQVKWIQVKDMMFEESMKEGIRRLCDIRPDVSLPGIHLYDYGVNEFGTAYVMVEDADGFYYFDEALLPDDLAALPARLAQWKQDIVR